MSYSLLRNPNTDIAAHGNQMDVFNATQKRLQGDSARRWNRRSMGPGRKITVQWSEATPLHREGFDRDGKV